VRRWLGDLGIRRVTAGHVERTLALAHGAARGVVALPGPARVVREAGALVCRAGRAPSDATFVLALSPGAAVDGPGWRLVLGDPRPWHAGEPMAPADGQALFDADAISGPLSVRSPRRGDRVRIAGVGTRKLHDVLVDRKIPREARAGLPVLAAGEVLLWVPGVVRTAAARVNAATRAVIEARFVACAAQPREAHDKPALPLAKPCGSIRRRSECT
jgi:tRNA(Ile)-lysidine synthetase-like protein